MNVCFLSLTNIRRPKFILKWFDYECSPQCFLLDKALWNKGYFAHFRCVMGKLRSQGQSCCLSYSPLITIFVLHQRTVVSFKFLLSSWFIFELRSSRNAERRIRVLVCTRDHIWQGIFYEARSEVLGRNSLPHEGMGCNFHFIAKILPSVCKVLHPK